MRLTLASEIIERPIEWVWEPRIPLAKTTLIEGDPGCGKSALTIAIAAHISTGRPWPDGNPCAPGKVIMLSTEDEPDDTIKPRLSVAQADLGKILIFTPNDLDDDFVIPDKVEELEDQVKSHYVRAVIIDPLVGFLSLKVNANEDHAVRRALRGLKFLSQNWGCSIITIRHLNKRPGISSIYRGGGSIAVIADARAAFIVSKHPTNPNQSIMMKNKVNLAGDIPAIAFELLPAEYYQPGAGKLIKTARLEWAGEIDMTPDAALGSDADIGEKAAIENAAKFLQEFLRDGPQESKELFRVMRASGVERKHLNRAAFVLHVIKFQNDKLTFWDLPVAR